MSFTASPSKLAGPSVYVKYWGNNSVRVDGKLFKYSLSSIVSLNGELVSEAKDVKPGDCVVVKHVYKGGRTKEWNGIVVPGLVDLHVEATSPEASQSESDEGSQRKRLQPLSVPPEASKKNTANTSGMCM